MTLTAVDFVPSPVAETALTSYEYVTPPLTAESEYVVTTPTDVKSVPSLYILYPVIVSSDAGVVHDSTIGTPA